jgi:DNA-binding HxlR family transcriptional regulator
MTAIKISSTNQKNKREINTMCPVTFTLSKIGGRWKTIIIYNLLSGTKRYSELKKAIPSITEKMLIQHLKEMESDQLIIRKAKPVIPPYVEYSLSKSGKELSTLMKAMSEWGNKYNKEKKY